MKILFRMFTLIELMVTIVIIMILLTLLAPHYSKSVRVAKNTLCVNQLKQLYHVGSMISDDRAIKSSGDADYQYGRDWPAIFAEYNENIGSTFFCPEAEEAPAANASQGDYGFYCTAFRGIIPLGPGPRARVAATYSNPPGWRLELEDAGDGDYNDLVVDIHIYPTYMEISTVSRNLGADVHFVDKNGEILIQSLARKPLGEKIRIGGVSVSDYGINKYFNGTDIYRLYNNSYASDKVFMTDYAKSVADPFNDDWDNWVVGEDSYTFTRHIGFKMNVTFVDGSVRSHWANDIHPDLLSNLNELWNLED